MSHPAASAEFRFYEELNDFLPPERRRASSACSVAGTRSVKDAIEAIGVPHTEVDLILVDRHSVGFDRVLLGGERVAVYPVFERLDIAPLQHLRPHLLGRNPLRVLAAAARSGRTSRRGAPRLLIRRACPSLGCY